MRARATMGLAIGAALAVAACTGDDSPSPSTTTTLPVTTAPERFARGEPDGVLTIGVLLPRTGSGASLGTPLFDVIDATVDAINANGGVAGQPIAIRVFDETAPASVDDLLGDPAIDAVIGPASSNTALAVLPTITEAGVAACSPIATSIALTGLPDQGLFFRTVASDALQARALASRINQTGLGSAALVYTDDVYGRPFAAAVRNALGNSGIPIVIELAYSPDDDDFTDEAAEVLAAEPPVIAMIGDAESGGRMVTALLAADGSAPKIVASDAIRSAEFGARTDMDELAGRVTGVSVSAFEGQEALLNGRVQPTLPPELAGAAFAAAAIDCVNLLALGAEAAGTPDAPQQIVASAIELSVGGQPCSDFVTCHSGMTTGLEVDYNGPTMTLTLDGNGDVTRAAFLEYGFDRVGNDVQVGTFNTG